MIKKIIPSFFTSLNLAAGCISIVFALKGELNIAGILIIVAAVLDLLDGMFARILNAVSEFGKQLDSLSDVVSFGVAPSMIIMQLMQYSLIAVEPAASFDIGNPSVWNMIIMYSAFLIAVFSALRLAKFNIDASQQKSFKGLPTPANALMITSLGFILENYYLPDASLGIYLYSSTFYGGLVATHLMNNKINIGTDPTGDSRLKSHFYLTGGYKYYINRDWAVEPVLVLKKVWPAPFQLDFNTRVWYKNILWGGISYRTQEAVSILLGYIWDRKFYIGYSYDIVLNPLGAHNYGSHELMLGYRFNDIKD